MFGWWQHLVASTCSAVLSRLITYPLDTLRVRVQSSSQDGHDIDGRGSARGGWQQLRLAIADVPIASLYNGLAVALVFSAPAVTLYMGTYDGLKWLLVDQLQWLTYDAFLCHIVGACAAEVVSNLMWTPMELIKSQMQAGRQHKSTSDAAFHDDIPFTLLTADTPDAHEQHDAAAAAAVDEQLLEPGNRHRKTPSPVEALTWRDACRIAYGIWRTHGPLGLLRGYWLGVYIYAPYSCIYFVVYERIKPMLLRWTTTAGTALIIDANTTYPVWIYLLGSAVACTMGAALTNPLDVVRTRWQVAHGHDRAVAHANHWFDMAVYLWRHEGRWRALMRGVWARVLSMVPGTVLGWTIFEMFRVYYTTPTIVSAATVSSLATSSLLI
ncbi:mitochondrial carrier domain-containing protein [Syncephalis pseudoplumigaleata]|uniref:Mitochondrial carrier domain-containing protein n=1 Tax=Syncephalis pseudoplumigaleata TaxID=1712513 RepID=A0A4P9Z6W0_9FUNG|nr:mitochondrial carrier domain-containing protein [Syncephalis pseudoplumigaleata]|eukprot:RKP28198.1 mitochondrial carrier domain-containing protein [Syncephalis pseudoplumigaleata]